MAEKNNSGKNIVNASMIYARQILKALRKSCGLVFRLKKKCSTLAFYYHGNRGINMVIKW